MTQANTQQNQQAEGRAMGWSEETKTDGSPRTLLPEGEYYFRVADIEKDFSVKKQANMAKVKLEVRDNDGNKAYVWDNIILHTDLEWKISEFFRALGLKKRGEAAPMRWDLVRDNWGKALIEQNTYKNNAGIERTNNKVKNYLDRDLNPAPDWCTEGAPDPNAADDDEAPF